MNEAAPLLVIYILLNLIVFLPISDGRPRGSRHPIRAHVPIRLRAILGAAGAPAAPSRNDVTARQRGQTQPVHARTHASSD